MDREWGRAISDPKRFGKLMGMTAILGELDVAARSAEEREERMVAQLRGYAAMTGNTPL